MSRDTLQLVLLNQLTQQHDHDPDKNVANQNFQNTQTQILAESSSSSDFIVPEIDDHEEGEGMCTSPLNEQLSSSNGVTTLELHPNVILGMPDDEGSAGSQDDDRPHMCTICRASYKTKTNLRRHMYVHTTSRPFPCQECGKGFTRKEHLTKHLEAVHSKCKHLFPYCDKQISRLDHLRRHIKIMHGYPEHSMDSTSTDKSAVLKVQVRGRKHKAQLSFLTPSFPTGTIGQTIITPIPLTATSNESTSNKNKRSSASDSQLKDEQGTSPSSPPSVFQQEDSQDDSPTSTSMTIIPSNVVGPGEGIATLAIQSTPTQKVLVHQRLPSGSTVNFATATNGLAGLADLSLSLGSHAPPQQPPSNTSATSSNKSSGKNGGGGDEKKIFQIFNCGQCNSTFTNEDDLAVHSRTHGKPQRYRCPECPRAYTRREKLTEHIRCVHEGQKFSCEFCGKE